MTDIKLQRYEKIEPLLEKYFGHSLDYIQNVVGFDSDGNEVEMSPKKVLKGINECGLWGMVDKENIIHYWYNGKADMDALIHFFAHEVSHIRYNTNPLPEDADDDLIEELFCDHNAEIAERAYELAAKVYQTEYGAECAA